MKPLMSYHLLPAIGFITLTAHSTLAQQPTPAPTPHQIVFTENSSTSLLATYDGSTAGITISNIAPEQWDVEFPTSLVWLAPYTDVWSDEGVGENGYFANIVVFGSPVTIDSDRGIGLRPATPDGFSINGVGTDSRDNVSISAIFHDNAAIAEAVPEASTFALILLSLAAWLVSSRLRMCLTRRCS
jgi:hypothetical protein